VKRLLCRKIALRYLRAEDGRLAAGSASAPAPHAPWAKIGLVNLDFTGKGPGFLHRHRHLHHSAPQALIDPLAGLAVDPSQFARRQRRYVRQNIFNNSLNLRSEILATKMYLFVIEAQYH
jgi:hypothetical protein